MALIRLIALLMFKPSTKKRNRWRKARRKKTNWHQPENLGSEQREKDQKLGRTKFYVYVLEIDDGHYIGHSYNTWKRYQQHKQGKTKSTAGKNPKFVWKSQPFNSREEAASFEAALKTLCKKESPKFYEIISRKGNG